MRTFTQKWAFLLVTLLCFAGLQVKADELTVAENATGSSSNVPAYGMYADTQGARAQCLYPADSLSDMAGGTITKLTFYLSSPASEAWTGTFQLSLKETDATSLSALDETDLITVYTGGMDASGSTLEVEFDEAFTYSGGNLIIDWYVSAAGNWKSASFTASSVTGAGCYRSSSSGSVSVVNYLPKVTFDYTPGAGGGPQCKKPGSIAASNISTSSADLNWENGENGSGVFTVEYKKAADQEWTVLIENTNALSASLSNLVSGTNYQARVKAICASDNLESNYVSVAFKTAFGVPFVESFDASTIPGGWANYTGLLSDVLAGTATLNSGSGWSFGTGNSVFDSHAKANIYGTSSKWLVTPAVEMTSGVELTFKLALTAYSGSGKAAAASDDRFVVLASTDNGATWTILREWNNTGAVDVYDNIATTGEEVTIDLSAYASGSLMIAFYGESTTSNGDNNLHIDDVKIALPPACFKPTDLAVTDGTLSVTSAEIGWIENNGKEAWKLQYKKSSETEWTEVDVASNPFTLSGLMGNTTYNVRIATVCDEEGTLSDYSSAISFTTLVGVPFLEEFSTTSKPAGWQGSTTAIATALASGMTPSGSSSAWSFGTNNGVFDSHARANVYGSYTKWLVTPAIILENPAMLSFDLALTAYSGNGAAAAAPDDRFVVLISTDGEHWTILREWNNTGSADVYDEIPTAGANYQIEIGEEYAGNSIMIAFCGESTVSNGDNNVHIDNVLVDAIPDCPKPSGFAVAEISKNSALVSWKRHDFDTGWKLQYKQSADSVWSEDIVLTDNSYNLSGLNAYTAYDVRVAANCDVNGEAQSTDYSAAFSFKTAAAVPFLETFNASGIPADWARFSGLYNEEEGVELIPATGWTVGAGNGVFAAAEGHLKLQIAGENTHNWIVSPTIEIEENVQLTFDLALTKTSGTLIPVESGVQNDDKFIVFYSTDNGETWEILKAWGEGLDEDFDGISSSANGQTIALSLSELAGENVIFAFYGESTETNGDNTIHIANVRVDFIPDCSNSASLIVNNLSAFSGTFVWDEEAGALWEFGIKENPAADFVPADDDFKGSTGEYLVTIDTLKENTPYAFFLRRNCSGAFSEVKTLNFRTIQNPATLPFNDDFESGNNWVFVNGEIANAWVYGTAASNGGSHALYISNDNGLSNAYTNNAAAMVYATKVIAFDETAIYQVSYDWICNGESTYDYLRVALVPLSEELVASANLLTGLSATALPEGWIALDGGSKLNEKTAWQTASQEALIPAGTYKLVLAWRDDTSTGTNPPAAVDNFAISKMDCPAPNNLLVVENSATINSVQLEWTPRGTESAWMVQYKKSVDAEWTTLAEPATEYPFTLTGLEASSQYEVRVAAWCDTESPEGISLFTAPVSFYTACGIVANFPYSEDFNGITGSSYDHVLPICWDYINTCTVEDFEIYPSVSTTNALFFGSQFEVEDYYGYTEPADPQDQYAILPQMDDLGNKRIKLDARAYSSYYVATFEIGIMSNPADTSTFVSLGSFTPASTSYQQFKLNLDSYEGEGKYIAIKMAAATSSEDHAVYIDNIVVEEIPACADIESVITVSDITAASATVSWTVEEGVSYKYAYTSAHEAVPADEAFISAEGDTVILSGLAENADYVFYLRRDCGSSLSLPLSAAFRTTQLPVNAPFSDDMEDGNKWLFVNGTSTNAWAYGSAAHNGEGSHAVYISNNGGVANAYNNSSQTMVFATRLCDFEAGTYAFSYDWKANGEDKYDFLRVALVPASETLTAGTTPTSFAASTLPAGWIALDGGAQLYGVSAWQHFESAEIEIPAGSYKLVLAWKNDYSGGSQEPAALDNFSVRTITCSKPTNLQAANLTATSADITWTSEQENIQLVYSTEASFNPDEAEIINVTANPFTLNTLTEQTNYYVYVRAICGEGEYSAWSAKLAFATKSSCETPTNLNANEITTSSAAISWEKYGNESFNLRYSEDGENWTVEPAVACPYTIIGLNANTAYSVQVQPVCAEADVWSAAMIFRTDCESLVIDENGWNENFDGITLSSAYEPSVRTMPSCWSAINTSTSSTYGVYPTVYYYSYTNYASSTPNSLRFHSYSSSDPQDQYAVLPQMDAVNTLRMSFKARAYSTSYDASFIVGVMSDPADTATFVPVATCKPTTTSYSDFLVAFNSYAGDGKYIAIKMEKANSSTSYRGVYIDNIHVELIPSCVELSDVAVSNITATTAQISWTNGSEDQSAWQIALGTEASFDKDAVTPVEADANPFTLTGLTPETTYYIYVRANCGEGDFSVWTARKSFRTVSTCQTPSNLKLESAGLNQATISWNTYGLSEFNVRYSTDGTNWEEADNVNSPYTITGLNASTSYRVQVQATCAEAETWSSVFTFKTAYGTPFAENFDAASKPADWNMYSGLLSSVQSGTPMVSSTYGWSFGTKNSIFNSHAYVNIYGTSCNRWLATPAITLTEDVQLTFDLALTKWSSAAAVNQNDQADDKFAVLISTDNGTSWDTLRIWDNQGSEYVYDAITNDAEGQPVALDLSAYIGQSVIIAFYGESTASGGDNALHIDNVLVDVAPACVKPTGLAVSGVSNDAATFTWNAEEGAAYQIAVVADPSGDFVPADDDFVAAASVIVMVDTLAENTAYVVYLRTDCGEDGYSEIISKAFHTTLVPAALPYDDDFESGNNWQFINGDLTNAWAVGSGANNTENGANAIYISNDGGTTNAYDVGSQAVVFAAKIFDFDKAGSYTFSYDWRSNGEAGYSIYDYLRVLLAPSSAELTAGTLPSGLTASAVPADWIALDGGALVSATEWQHKDVTVDDINPGLYQVVFVWRNDGSSGSQTPAAIDNIHIQHLAYPTGINETGAGIENKAVKFIYNNQVYILLNGNVYNITGQKVELR